MLNEKGLDGIQLSQDRDQWRAFVNTVMNTQVQAGYCSTLGLCKLRCLYLVLLKCAQRLRHPLLIAEIQTWLISISEPFT
jgi:hypothetical protein